MTLALPPSLFIFHVANTFWRERLPAIDAPLDWALTWSEGGQVDSHRLFLTSLSINHRIV
jgi:hypothetical protein